ncbi:MAG: hypothetical protein IT346_02000 [Epsilonproteobacteria bacterium]|nr:hypothetical protein [Campylobacterota bacterium]
MTHYILLFIATLRILPLHADEEFTYDTSNRFYPHQNPYVEPRATLATYEKRPQDRAKEQFRASCNALDRLQQFPSPSYPIQNINAQVFASWSATDFARAAESTHYEAMKQGHCRHHVEKHMLRAYDFYSVPAFREYIKTIAGYRSHIKKLHARLQAQKSRWHHVWRKCGFSDPNYIQQLDMAERLNAEILKEEAIERTVAKQQQRLAALETQQRMLQAQQALRHQQESARNTFESQRNELSQLSDEWSCMQDMYQEHDLCDGGRYKRRQQALQRVMNLEWTNHGFKHVPPKNVPWKEIVKATKHGRAFYKPGINIKELEFYAWQNGTPTTSNKNWKVFKAEEVIGANQGKETIFMRVECSANTVHGHLILESDYWEYLK